MCGSVGDRLVSPRGSFCAQPGRGFQVEPVWIELLKPKAAAEEIRSRDCFASGLDVGGAQRPVLASGTAMQWSPTRLAGSNALPACTTDPTASLEPRPTRAPWRTTTPVAM